MLTDFIYELYEKLEEVISKWSKEVGRPAAYRFNSENKEITIYTRCPGIFIGYAGETINKYKKELCEVLCTEDVSVKFIEIDGVVA